MYEYCLLILSLSPSLYRFISKKTDNCTAHTLLETFCCFVCTNGMAFCFSSSVFFWTFLLLFHCISSAFHVLFWSDSVYWCIHFGNQHHAIDIQTRIRFIFDLNVGLINLMCAWCWRFVFFFHRRMLISLPLLLLLVCLPPSLLTFSFANFQLVRTAWFDTIERLRERI